MVSCGASPSRLIVDLNIVARKSFWNRHTLKMYEILNYQWPLNGGLGAPRTALAGVKCQLEEPQLFILTHTALIHTALGLRRNSAQKTHVLWTATYKIANWEYQRYICHMCLAWFTGLETTILTNEYSYGCCKWRRWCGSEDLENGECKRPDLCERSRLTGYFTDREERYPD